MASPKPEFELKSDDWTRNWAGADEASRRVEADRISFFMTDVLIDRKWQNFIGWEAEVERRLDSMWKERGFGTQKSPSVSGEALP